ncbi:Bax inhibitor 1, partial [Coemansia biformis]
MKRATPPEKSTPLESFSQTAQLTPRSQRQIVDVYLTLASTAASAVGGHITVERLPFIEDWSILLVLGAFVLGAAVFLSPATEQNLPRRRTMLWGVGWVSGILMHSAVAPLMYYGQADIVYMALGIAIALFASFAVAVMTSSRSQVIYATGAAAFAISSLSWIGLLGLIFPSRILWDTSLLVGLAVPGVSAVVHTRNMLDEAASGVDIDPVTYALRFFGNLVNMFAHLLALLRNNRERDEEDSR